MKYLITIMLTLFTSMSFAGNTCSPEKESNQVNQYRTEDPLLLAFQQDKKYADAIINMVELAGSLADDSSVKVALDPYVQLARDLNNEGNPRMAIEFAHWGHNLVVTNNK